LRTQVYYGLKTRENTIKERLTDPGSVAHPYNPSYSGGGDWEDHSSRPVSGKRQWWCKSVITATQVAQVGGSWSEASPGKNMQDPTRKIAKTEEGGGIGQVVEYLPSKGEALSSNTNTAKRKKKGEERG
jgi:hypothetical protein